MTWGIAPSDAATQAEKERANPAPVMELARCQRKFCNAIS